MAERSKYLKLASLAGWQVIRDPLENLSLLAAFVAAFGLPTGVGFLGHAGALGLAVGTLLTLALVLVEGGFRVARGANEQIKSHLDYELAQVRLQQACQAWCDEVSRFLEARAAAAPPPPHRELYEAMKAIGREEQDREQAMREALAAHERETVARYIERHRDRGDRLFDALVDLEHIVGDSREHLRAPADVWQIKDGVTSVEFGAERIIGWIRPELAAAA